MPHKAAWRPLYPFRSRFLDLDGHSYHYVDEGQGETLLLVHGNPTWSFYWRNVIRAMRDRYRLVAVDHIGCGLSDKPQQYPYRLATHVANLGRLISELDLRNVTLVAHDWGGAIGIGAAVAMPDRFRRFALLNTAAFRAPSIPWRIRACRIPFVGALGVRGLNGFARAALSMATNHPERMTPDVQAGYLAPYDSWAHRVAIQRFVEDIPIVPSHPSYDTLLNIEQGLAKFAEAPMLLAWGMRDWCFTPWFLERFRDFFPRAEVLRLADAGHYVVEDAHERIVPALAAFLAAHPLGNDLSQQALATDTEGRHGA